MKQTVIAIISSLVLPTIIEPILEESHARFHKVPHYGTICIDDPSHCDFSWDEKIPMLERLPKDMILSMKYFKAVSKTFVFN